MKYSVYLLFLLLIFKTAAQTQLKLMSYNLLHYPTGTGGDRSDALRYVLNDYQPDIFMACEIENETGANEILDYCLGSQNYASATFSYNHSGNYYLQQLLFYNKYKFELVQTTYLVTTVRDINHYTLILNAGNATDSVYIDIYIGHLKAGNYSNDPQIREAMVNVLLNDLSNIPSGHFVVFAGDFNFYSATEPAYQNLLNPANAVVFKDPIDRPGSWHNNVNFKDIHTQSTHALNENNFVGGGLDDRFDFILLSEDLMNSPVLHYINGSYAAYGNNGNCFNHSIVSSYCQGTTYDFTLRQNLYNTSDHLPVVLTLETPLVLKEPEYICTSDFSIAEGNIVYSGFHILSSVIGVFDLNIYNTTGQLVKNFDNCQNADYIDVSDCASGIYFITIQDLNNQQFIKFVKTD